MSTSGISDRAYRKLPSVVHPTNISAVAFENRLKEDTGTQVLRALPFG
ncbi:hypothetical protein [Nostoc sp.]